MVVEVVGVVIDVKLVVEVEVAGFMVDLFMVIADFKAHFVEVVNFAVVVEELMVNFVEEVDFKVNFVEAVIQFNVHFAKVVPILIADFDFAVTIDNFLFTATYSVVDLAVI